LVTWSPGQGSSSSPLGASMMSATTAATAFGDLLPRLDVDGEPGEVHRRPARGQGDVYLIGVTGADAREVRAGRAQWNGQAGSHKPASVESCRGGDIERGVAANELSDEDGSNRVAGQYCGMVLLDQLDRAPVQAADQLRHSHPSVAQDVYYDGGLLVPAPPSCSKSLDEGPLADSRFTERRQADDRDRARRSVDVKSIWIISASLKFASDHQT
jgi:hypothetical protein